MIDAGASEGILLRWTSALPPSLYSKVPQNLRDFRVKEEGPSWMVL